MPAIVDATVGRIKTAVGSVKTPKLPSTPKLPEGKFDVAKLRQGTVDYAGKLPTPVDVVEGAFGLVDRAFEQQRKITSGVISKAAALRPGAAEATVEEDTKVEPKPAAKKPAAKAAAAK